MYELGGVYEYAGADVFSLGAVGNVSPTNLVTTAVKGTMEEAARRATDQLKTIPGGMTTPAVASTGINSKLLIGLGAAAFLLWYLFLRKK